MTTIEDGLVQSCDAVMRTAIINVQFVLSHLRVELLGWVEVIEMLAGDQYYAFSNA